MDRLKIYSADLTEGFAGKSNQPRTKNFTEQPNYLITALESHYTTHQRRIIPQLFQQKRPVNEKVTAKINTAHLSIEAIT